MWVVPQMPPTAFEARVLPDRLVSRLFLTVKRDRARFPLGGIAAFVLAPLVRSLCTHGVGDLIPWGRMDWAGTVLGNN